MWAEPFDRLRTAPSKAGRRPSTSSGGKASGAEIRGSRCTQPAAGYGPRPPLRLEACFGGDAFRVPGSDELDELTASRSPGASWPGFGWDARRRLNAGTGDSEMLVDTSYDEWRKIIATNLDGTFVCMREAAKHMVKNGNGGRLIAVTSVHEHQPRVGSGPYDAAKHGIGGLIKTFALELGQHNITANAVAPGEIATPMTGQEDEDPRNEERLGHPARTTRRCSRNRRCDCISCEPSGRLRDGCVVGRRRGHAADGAAGWLASDQQRLA